MRSSTYRQFVCLFLLACSFLGYAAAQEATLRADAYTSPTNSATKYGVSPVLLVTGSASTSTLTNGANNRVWLNFDLPALPPNTSVSQISKATLTLYADRVYAAGAFDVFLVSGSFGETTINDGSAPAAGVLVAAIEPFPSISSDGVIGLTLGSFLLQ